MADSFDGVTICPLLATEIDGAILDQLRARLADFPRFTGPAAISDPPVLWFRLGSRKAGVLLDDAVRLRRRVAIFPWGWDFTFGAVLTITVQATGLSGPPPSVGVAVDDPVFPLLEKGRFIAVFASGDEVVTCLRVDLSAMELPAEVKAKAAHLPPAVDEGNGFYRAQWERVRRHVPLVTDPGARYWESVHHREIFKKYVTAGERLSLGWFDSYKREVRGFAAMLKEMHSTHALDAADASGFPRSVQLAVAAAKTYDAGKILACCRSLRRELADRPFYYLIEELGKYMDATHGTPISAVIHSAVWVYLRGTDVTESGRRMPWFNDVGQLEFTELHPEHWPDGTPIAEYWDRTPGGIL